MNPELKQFLKLCAAIIVGIGIVYLLTLVTFASRDGGCRTDATHVTRCVR